MASPARPQVSVFDRSGNVAGSVALPEVFSTVVRPDVVHFVHTNVAKNARMAYAVSTEAGYQTSAESWGTGRAVARIPRVAGGGTHRAGQAAFGNMCRGGGMYSPTKTYRRWHRAVPATMRRHAVASALAASAVAALVMARGHKVQAAKEIPIVCTDEIEQLQKTKEAHALLTKLGCGEDLLRCAETRQRRHGKSVWRNRVHSVRRGPLVVYNGTRDQMRAFRNIPGVETCHVSRLNLLQLAPGATVGRLLIFSESAFKALADIYEHKKDYSLPRDLMTNTDVQRIINSDEIQSVLRVKKDGAKPKFHGATNALKREEVVKKLALKKLF
ncbi:60S ribosomal protein L4 [Gregarina niphandrodes]|uniref:Large ribosomal subunit protein uL4 n=1 Tax=Gregarina niphandrodes TaxID=110365 RepID=A0A023B6Y8_GRENI|nr:60S ribosomal protein L4 [Gregarina niphandrodes]EZG66827.1 60S ribosomal protein L4 [Gregarina niphandrodes]|eukprot:XP_011130470.1 60S ribosomal protein L4 [Gregarina niphandrodes]